MASTDPRTYTYEARGHTIAITRRHIGSAYARNGNVHNPTQYFTWELTIDGEFHGSYFPKRADAYEYALNNGYCNENGRVIPGIRGGKNVRNYQLVAAEMRLNIVKGAA